jgi:hypothetical protein
MYGRGIEHRQRNDTGFGNIDVETGRLMFECDCDYSCANSCQVADEGA